MTKPILAFSLLVHDNLDQSVQLIKHLAEHDVFVVIHVDQKCSAGYYDHIRSSTGDYKNVFFAERVNCKWGEWSLVQAELNCIKCIEENNLAPKYIHNLSGSDVPLKPIDEFIRFLSTSQLEYIESYSIDKFRWVVDGLSKERFRYFFPFNYLDQRYLFTVFLRIQKLLGISRSLPEKLHPALGSQFKTITLNSAKRVLRYIEAKPEIVDYFKYVWIPDEAFFPTLVNTLIDDKNIANYNLTYYSFNSYGKPKVLGKRQLQRISYTHKEMYFARKACYFNADDAKNLDTQESKELSQTHMRNILNAHCFSRILGYVNKSHQYKVFNNKPMHILISDQKNNKRSFIEYNSESTLEIIEDIFCWQSVKKSLFKYCKDESLLESWFGLSEQYTYEYIFNINELIGSKELVTIFPYKFIDKNKYFFDHHYNRYYIFDNELTDPAYSYLLMDLKRNGMNYHVYGDNQNMNYQLTN